MRTQVTNTSGANKFFGFIPPHGQVLADGASVTVDGDLRTVLAAGRGRFNRKKEIAALEFAITEGEVTVEPAAETSSSSS